MLSVIMLSVVTLSVVMLSVMAPQNKLDCWLISSVLGCPSGVSSGANVMKLF